MQKTIVITGASGGMGAAICKSLAEKGGFNLALCSKSEEKLAALLSELNATGINVIGMAADVRNEPDVEKFFAMVRKEFGQSDVLINLAGLSIPSRIEEMRVEDYDLIMDVNVKGTFLCCKHFVPLTCPERGAKILNVSSMAAVKANGTAPLYCTAKAAVNMFSKTLSIQLKEKNIRVMNLNPGGADTGFWGDRKVAREKLMTAQNIADVVEFILSMDDRMVIHEMYFESFYNL